MKRKIRVLSTFVILLPIAASLASWAAWSPPVSQAIEPMRVELQPAGRDTVSLETRKKLLEVREADLLAHSEAALAARKQQLNPSGDVNNCVREHVDSRKILTVARMEK